MWGMFICAINPLNTKINKVACFFWDVTQPTLVVTDVSGQTTGPNCKGQAV
jgi:hypothetical protein